jgi:hypothetical protein
MYHVPFLTCTFLNGGIMKEIIPIVLFGLVFACAITVKADDSTPKHYTCYQAKEPVIINAILNKPVWKKIPPMDNWLITADPKKLYKPATLPTTAWMCWDQDNLYIAFECIDKDIVGSRAKKDTDVWEDDAFEIFIDPNGDGKNYVEIEVNPLNTTLDLLIAYPRLKPWTEDAKFNIMGLRTAVRTYGTLNYKYDEDEKWVGEILIPWQSLSDAINSEKHSLPPNDGDTWRINLYRSEHGSKKGVPQEWHSWSPIPTNHMPSQFGYVTFSKKTL